MYLKKIEIFGFKSFADKSQLEFHAGVTGIVGPNGCGKSNVSDAIKWVLGEQSARSLRGLRMDDVIFNGTTSEQPVNYAEVSIHFSNEDKRLPVDYEEVVVTRRLYRDGVSEYSLNRNPIRLKDIQSLLAGTGLGVGSYSVIEQGRIDRILNAKPEDRRVLFEEAAGITKYRNQKKEALRNLEATEQNLQRVTDILAELKRQINSMERQAKRAAKYKEGFDRLKRFDVAAALRTRAEQAGRVTLLLDEKNRLAADEALLASDLQGLLSLKTEVQGVLADSENQCLSAKESIVHHESQIQSLEGKILFLRKYSEESKGRTEALVREIETTARRIEELKNRVDFCQKEFTAVEREHAAGATSFRLLEFGQSEIEDKLAARRDELHRIERERGDWRAEDARLRNEWAGLLAVEESSRERLTEYGAISLAVHEDVAAMTQKRRDVHKETEALQVEIRSKIIERERAERLLDQNQSDLAGLTENRTRLEHEIAALESRLDVLESLFSRHEGFSTAARFLLEQRGADSEFAKGLAGALADLVEVNPGYELALESALEFFSQGLVCSNEPAILAAKERLAVKGQGKAVLLAAFAADAEDSSVEDAPSAFEPGVARLSEFTRAHASVTRVYQKLVKNVFVCESFGQALTLSQRYADCAFVTKEGDLCRGPLVVISSAQAAEDNSMLFGRETRIRDLRSKLMDLRFELERLQGLESGASDDAKSLQESLRHYQDLLPKLQVRLADLQSGREHLDAALEKEAQKLEAANREVSEWSTKLSACEQRKLDTGTALEGIHADVARVEARMDSLRTEIAALTAEREESIRKVAEAKANWETLEQRFEAAQKNDRSARESLAAEEESLAAKIREKELGLTRLQELRMETEGSARELALKEEALRDLLAEYERLKEALDRVQLEYLEIENQIRQKQEVSRERTARRHEAELEEGRLSRDLALLKERTVMQYELVLDDLLSEEWPVPEESFVEIEELRETLKKMGPVNLVAVEEHDELVKRHDFLDREREDLTKAKDDIHKALLKINRTTRELFVNTFTQVQTYFEEYYKLLFGGGKAEILLLDESDVLESGIEIIARPPGKKLQSIMLLSGGEKALTSIALMFALFKVKPSPFCVLDEIDAPLDDVNVQRFTRVLQEFVKETQFVIITHNKRTMSIADTMYGVTMQRSGVSKVVSVRFEEAKGMAEPSRPSAARAGADLPAETVSSSASAHRLAEHLDPAPSGIAAEERLSF